MKKNLFGLILICACILVSSCKTEFEKVRVSGNPTAILKTAFQYYDKKQYQKAQTLFELVVNNLRGQKDAEKAYFCYAYTHYYLKEYILGAYYFKNFSNTFTNSDQREEASYMSAYCNYLQSPSYRLDQGATITAIEEFQTFVNLFPQSKKVGECNQRIDELRRKQEEKAFAEGELYFNLRQYQSAVISFDNLLKDYPESPDVERVRYLIAKSDFLLSKNSVVTKKDERYTETIKRCNEFLEKYKSGTYTKDIREIKKESERILADLRKKNKNT